MIDDMQGLYSHASDAFRAGRARGCNDVLRAVEEIVIRASVRHEAAGSDAAFHAVQDLAKELRQMGVRLNVPKHAI